MVERAGRTFTINHTPSYNPRIQRVYFRSRKRVDAMSLIDVMTFIAAWFALSLLTAIAFGKMIAMCDGPTIEAE